MKKQNSKNSLRMRSVQKLFSNRLAMVGLGCLVLIILACMLAPVLTPYDPMAIDPKNKLLPMSWEHPLGTDQLGRDLLSRILYGGRTTIAISLISAVLPTRRRPYTTMHSKASLLYRLFKSRSSLSLQ